MFSLVSQSIWFQPEEIVAPKYYKKSSPHSGMGVSQGRWDYVLSSSVDQRGLPTTLKAMRVTKWQVKSI